MAGSNYKVYAIILYEEEFRIDPVGNAILIIKKIKSYSVRLTEGQKANLVRAYKNRSPITIRLKNDQLKGNFPFFDNKTSNK